MARKEVHSKTPPGTPEPPPAARRQARAKGPGRVAARPAGAPPPGSGPPEPQADGAPLTSPPPPLGPQPDPGSGWRRLGGWWVLPDAAEPQPGQKAVLYRLPTQPLVALDPAGRPVVSLTLQLSRPPTLTEPSVTSLLVGGVLTADLVLSQDGADLNEPERVIRPLYCTSVGYRLTGLLDRPVTAQGVTARAGLSLTLGREHTLTLLAALNRTTSVLTPLPLSAEVSYDTARVTHLLTLTSEARRLHAGLQAMLDPQREGRGLDRTALEQACLSLLSQGLIESSSGDAAGALRGFLRTLGFVRSRGDGSFVIDPASPAPGPLSYTERLTGAATGHFTVEADLAVVLATSFETRSSEGHVHLVAAQPGGGWAAVPERSDPQRTARAMPGAALMLVGHTAMSSSLALRPQVAGVATHQLLVASATPTLVHSGVQQVALGGLVFEPVVAPHQPPLPQVDDAALTPWPDRINPKDWWYAPEVRLVAPAPNQAPADSPFLFEFETSGHDLTGQPGLKATIRVTLATEMGPATNPAWSQQGQPAATAVEMIAPSAELELPFRDAQGADQVQRFSADTLTMNGGRLQATFRLLDAWARLAYGALSTPGFQLQPARVRVSYQFDAYTPTPDRLEWLGVHTAALAVASTPLELKRARGPVFDEQHQAFHLPTGTVTYAREPRAGPARPASRRRGAPRSSGPPEVPAAYRLLPLPRKRAISPLMQASLQVRPQLSAVVIRPEVTVNAELIAQFARKYSLQRLARLSGAEALLPCTGSGELYRQVVDGASQAVGCQDSFKLGQTEFRQYRHLQELDRPGYQVWRSLQQPGRFLVAPTRYDFSRFGPGDGERAFRPAVYLYSSIDANDLTNSRCVVMGTLQAGLTPFDRQVLEDALLGLHPAPTTEYLSGIEARCQVTFALPAGRLEASAVRLWDGFQVTIRCDVDEVPQLRAMLETGAITGAAQFTLPDGTVLAADLHLDLGHIVGPWDVGAVTPVVGAAGLTLTNRAECAADVRRVTYADEAGRTEVNVGRRLAPGESVDLSVPAGITAPVCEYLLDTGPVDLSEIRSFIEDIHSNVVFLNLVNHSNHHLSSLEVTARLQGLPEQHQATLAEGATVTLDLVLPLTTYLANPTLEFQVRKTAADGTQTSTPWLAWSLSTLGHVIPLGWDIIQADQAP